MKSTGICQWCSKRKYCKLKIDAEKIINEHCAFYRRDSGEIEKIQMEHEKDD